MNLRELLRYEIWSKRTTRKMLIVLGAVCGVLVVGFVTLYLVEYGWITPQERNVGRAALALIDDLENSNSIGDEEFGIRDKQAQDKVESAQGTASTIRDGRIAAGLYAYLVGVETDRSDAKMRDLMKQRHLPVTDSDRKSDLTGIQVTQFVRSALHKALD